MFTRSGWRIPRRWVLALLSVSTGLAVYFVLLSRFSRGATTTTINVFPSGPNISRNLDFDGFHIIVTGSDQERDHAGSGSSLERRPAFSSSTGAMMCNVPKLDINGAEVMGFFHESEPIKCKKPENWAFIDRRGLFSLISSRSEASCFVTPILRVSDDELTYGSEMPISVGDSLPVDFVRVRCVHNGKNWDGLLMTVVRNEDVVNRAKLSKRPPNWSGLDVYFLGFDSLSQMTFRRKLPKTVEYFEKAMGGAVLDAYNIVGDGTPQAFIPILTAGTEEELPLTRKRFLNASFVDDVYPFIWRNFSDAGYATLYGEDAANIGTFTYRLKGFRQQPTDHFTRTFFQEHERVSFGKCSGSESVHKNWFRYCKEFMQRYKDIPRFLLMHLSMFSHDDINEVGGIDDDLAAHLRKVHEEGLLDNSLVILMADHGHRFAGLRETHQGQLEERLPFFSLALPKKFREGRMRKAWNNLLRNRGILSTPFDIHATLMDILHFPSETELTREQDPNLRSLSLLRPIPTSRNCQQADVAPHWCTCLNWENALSGSAEDQDRVVRMASAVVNAINAQTEPERTLCAPLKLKKLFHVKRMVPNEGLLKYKSVKDADGFVPDLSGSAQLDLVYYQLKLETAPGDATYEITLHEQVSQGTLHIDLNSISHVNKYGDRPHCIIDKNYFLATFCVCYDRV